MDASRAAQTIGGGDSARAAGPATVRDTTFDVLRRLGLTKLFSNPGSTEVPFLAGMPDDLEFVLGLHEGSVVGMAAGYALGRGAPALVLLHSTPGLGNAVAAIATARQNRAPLVIVVGQQDRRHLAQDPFLAGRLDGLTGGYAVWLDQPARAADVPGALVRAYWEAQTARGPAIVIVPMDDWSAPAPEPWEVLGPARLLRSAAADPVVVEELADVIDAARRPTLVAGAGADGEAGWRALVALAERLGCPVWQEPFGGAAGFPQDHPRFAGHLPARRARLREVLSPFDLVIVVGTGALRQYPYDNGPLVGEGTDVVVLTQDPAEAHRSPATLAALGDPAALCAALAQVVARPDGGVDAAVPPTSLGGAATPSSANGSVVAPAAPMARPAAPAPPAAGEPLRAGHVLAALAERLPRDAILVEETPSSRPELHQRVAIAQPGGFVSAMGLLGFALPAAIGLRLACPDRGVISVTGDGATLYQVLALWSAGTYAAGTVFLVLSNGGYAIMDRLAERAGAPGPWPALDTIDITGLASSLGVETLRITDHAQLLTAFDDLLPTLARRATPLLVEAVVAPDEHFDP
ncbi:MAG TPA: thiamine pyrophosphate-binding protein [Baekduia sp.]|uniref:thiamine pyrophosphate-binding protein n=1 Tax=Baekduia sp. TaxID=2600305 RepID=UPI002D7881BD|nr:thiamine pyrophosphate-binding protein [Baekduia sp.]HET6507316.1 thiamine pyrophosphate-binding protein [Baekduia sp.]